MIFRRTLLGLFLVLIVAAPLHAEQNLHQAGEILWQGEGVRVHNNQTLTEDRFADLCDSVKRKVSPPSAWHKLSVVFSGDADKKIDYGAAYEDLVVRKIVPVLQAKCGFVNPNIVLYNFVSDVAIGRREGKRPRVYRSAERWKEIQAIPWEERHARNLDLTDAPLSECKARMAQGAWSIQCSRFEDYFGKVPLEAYRSIAGLIAWELELPSLSEGQRRQLAAYEVAHSEARDRVLDLELETQERERRAAREREWNRDPCAEQPRASGQGPSAFDVCTAVAAKVSEASSTGKLASAIWSAFSDQRERKPDADFRLGTFKLRSCVPRSDAALRFECAYSFDLKRRGDPDPFLDLIQGVLIGTGVARAEFEVKDGRWRSVSPPPPAYHELPSCWLGDVRVRWGDCRL